MLNGNFFKRMPALLIACLAGMLQAQDGGRKPDVEVVPLGHTLYKLICKSTPVTSVIASAGVDGILLVDSAPADASAALHEKLDSLGRGEVKLLINTHYHPDHTGGNAEFGRTAVILAHPNVKKRMTSGYSILQNYPEHALPVRSVTRDTTIRFNGEEIRLIPMTGGHTDGDLIVHFPGANIVFMADQIFPDMFPYMDLAGGGDVDTYVKNLERALGLFGEDVLYLSSHGRDYSAKDVRTYIDMIEKTCALIRAETAKGATAAELKQRKILKDWENWGRGLVQSDFWIDLSAAMPGAIRAPVIDPLVEVLKDKDADAAVQLYRKLKQGRGEEYDFSEPQLNVLGYWLLQKGRAGDAVRIFELNVEVFPGAWNTYDSLAEGYMTQGNKELAVQHYKKSLELNPQNDNAREKLKILE
ncbi:MBL fold metallo-hydrolase [bacterium]|nr:MBL fold metallo-hydrolase [bacterium]